MRFRDAIAAQGRNLRQSGAVVAAALGQLDLEPWRSHCLALTGMGASTYALSAVLPGLLDGGQRALALAADELASAVSADIVDSVVVVSQGGTSTETLEAISTADRLPRLVITNDPVSPVAGLADSVVPLGLLEDSAVYTLGYTAAIQALGRVTEALVGPPDDGWEALPDTVEGVLAGSAAIVSRLADRLGVPRAVDCVGSGAHSAAASEGALVLREAAAVPTSFHPLRQYLHGPMEALGDGLILVVIGADREVRLAHDVAAAGTDVLLVTTADAEPADHLAVVRLPALEPAQLAVLEILPIQLLASELAARQGREVTGFRFEQADTKVAGPKRGQAGSRPAGLHWGSLGIDVGGTKLAVALTRGRTGALEFFEAAPTPKEDAEEIWRAGERLVEQALELARRERIEVAGIGVAVPEVIGLDGRILSHAVVPGLDGDEWRRRLERIAPVVVESDVRAGARGEAVRGRGRGLRSFCYVSVGTGISYALVLNGVIYRGARGAAIQLGNSVAAEWETDGVRHKWVLEEIASGPAMLTRYLKLGGIGATTEAVLAAYGEQEAATRAVRETARAFGIGLGLLVNLLDPDVVVVGGGLGSAPGPFWDLGVAAARDHVWCDAARSLPILQAELGPRSAAVGAAIVGFEASRPVLT